jgi:hypothetical protein
MKTICTPKIISLVISCMFVACTTENHATPEKLTNDKPAAMQEAIFASEPCPAGGTLDTWLFCLVSPGGNINKCWDRFESQTTACSYEEAKAAARRQAINYTLHDGACPPCELGR